MQIILCAIGKAKQGVEQSLYQHYIARLPWKVQLVEITPKTGRCKAKEGEALLEAATRHKADALLTLDERGQHMSSPMLAEQFRHWQDHAQHRVACMIGGADGLDASVRAASNLCLALGSLTWPHMLVRAMLAEQLYRSWSLLNNHPYHRT